MKLEWFRHHKNFVYWVLLPIVGGGMAFFGLSSVLSTGGLVGGKSGPAITYTVGDVKRTLSPSDVITWRTILTLFYRGNHFSTDQVALHTMQYATAVANGFELGNEEFKERVRQTVKDEIQMRERDESGDIELTPEVYKKLLQSMQMTASQFEQVTHDLNVISKYRFNIAAQAKASDPEIFVKFCEEKEVARLRYKEVKGESFLEKTTEPDEKKISEFYEKHKDNRDEIKDLFTQPKMSADLLFYNPEKLIAEIKPTEAELKQYYEDYKTTYWVEAAKKDEAKKDEPAPKEGEPVTIPEVKYKPFESVKAEVEEKWMGYEKKARTVTRVNKLKGELKEAEEKFAADEAKKPVAEQKPFDLDAWAKEHGFTHWTTPEQTEEQYKAGKKEVGAKDALWVEEQLFKFAQPEPRALERLSKEFKFPDWIDPLKPELGLVIARMKAYVQVQLKPLAEAKPVVIKQLKIQAASELAKKEAQRIHDDWKAGKDLPDANKLEEVSADRKSNHPLASKFFSAPAGAGEVFDVAEGGMDDKLLPESSVAPRKYYIGFAVERKLPTLDTFAANTEWKREDERRSIQQMDFYSMYNVAYTQQMKDAASKVGADSEPPLFQEYRKGGPVPLDF